MKKTTAAVATLLCLMPVMGAGTSFLVQPAAAAEKQVSAKMGKPLKEAQSLIQERRYKEALAKVEDAEALSTKTPYENFVVDSLKAAAYQGMRNYGEAANALEAALGTGQVPESQVAQRRKEIFQLYAASGNSAKMLEAGTHYLKDVGPDADVEAQLAQAYSTQHNYKQAEDMIRAAIKTAEGRGATVKEEWLELLRFVDHEQGNTAGEQSALELLVQHYPSSKYWEDLLDMASRNIKSPTASLDIERLKLLTGNVKTADDYMNMAQDALQQSIPAEAKKVMQMGMQKGVLGQGPQKDRHQRLLDMASRQTAADTSGLAAADSAAQAAATGDGDVKVGMTYWSLGQYDKAAQLIQAGIKKGVKNPDEAQLHLGMVLISAGKKTQAVAAFRAVRPNTPTAQLARLWALYASTHS